VILEQYDEHKLIELFSPYGDIIQARVIRDQSTESPRGIAFVIMGTRSQAQCAGQLFAFELCVTFIVLARSGPSQRTSHRSTTTIVGEICR
jgi:hypothetical protein